MNLKSLFRLSSFLIFFLGCSALFAARFPNAVSKKIIFQGKAAQEIAALLGLDLNKPSELKLRLHSSNEWAVYLRDTPNPDATSHNIERPRYNLIKYNPSTQQLSIEGDWLDTQTSSSPSKPRFSFGSPFISESNLSVAGWEEILKKNLPSSIQTREYGKIISEKKLENENFKLTIYQTQDYTKNPKGEWGYQIQITAE